VVVAARAAAAARKSIRRAECESCMIASFELGLGVLDNVVGHFLMVRRVTRQEPNNAKLFGVRSHIARS